MKSPVTNSPETIEAATKSQPVFHNDHLITGCIELPGGWVAHAEGSITALRSPDGVKMELKHKWTYQQLVEVQSVYMSSYNRGRHHGVKQAQRTFRAAIGFQDGGLVENRRRY